MAVIYLSSVDGNDGDSGLTWALAKATAAAAATAAGAGGTVYVDHAHAETSGSTIAILSPGTAASPIRFICVDRTGNPEPPTARATTATITTTGGTAELNITGGFAYFYGIEFRPSAGMRLSEAASGGFIFEQCHFNLTSAIAAAFIYWVVVVLRPVVHINCTFTFGNVGQIMFPGGRVTFLGGSLAGTIPTTLIRIDNATVNNSNWMFRGMDLSAAGSGKTLVAAGVNNHLIQFDSCKYGSSVTIAAAQADGAEVRSINSDSADTNYRYFLSNRFGVITQETTIVRTGGASDGTTPISRKMVTTANSKIYSPLVLDDILIPWNESTGSSKTVTVEVVTDGVTLTDAECWLEVEYLGTSGFPISSFVHDRVADDVFGTPANQTSSSETWTTTGLASPVKQKLSVSFTPQEKGAYRARVMLAKASTTVYVDPLATVA